MADLRTRRAEPTSLRQPRRAVAQQPPQPPPQPRAPRPHAAQPRPPLPADADATVPVAASRSLQWAVLFSIVLAAVWLMFGTPAMDLTAGLAEPAAGDSTVP